MYILNLGNTFTRRYDWGVEMMFPFICAFSAKNSRVNFKVFITQQTPLLHALFIYCVVYVDCVHIYIVAHGGFFGNVF